MQIEVAASSSPFSYVSLRDHNRSAKNKPYINSRNVEDEEDSSWLPSHTEDSSWLPTSSSSRHNSNSESKDLNHHNVDDSWLPVVDNSNRKYGTNTNDLEDDTDYSWLPSSFVENGPQKKSRNCHWALAREVVFSSSSDQPNQHHRDYHRRTKPSQSEAKYIVVPPTSGGVSSLLQRWRDLAEAKNCGESNNTGSIGSESKTKNDNNSPCSPVNTKDSDWESDKASRRLSCPLPSRDSKDSNPGGAEKEKIRVVDIIKKLSREEELAASHAAESLPRIHTNSHEKEIQGEQRVKVSRHLVRGRQAFNNFLMQMEHQKQYELKCLVERKAVSKFSHRGRIQASLRFKILRQPKPETKTHRRCVSKTLESNNRLDIMDLRERFNSGVKKGATESRKPKRNEESLATTTKEVVVKTTTVIRKQENNPKKEPNLTSNQSTQYSTTFGKDHVVHKAKFEDSSSNFVTFKDEEKQHYKDGNKFDFYEDEGQFMSARTSYSQMEDRGFSDSEETGNRKGLLESFNDWITIGYSQTPSELDGNDSDMQLFDTNYDWISEISRPKSDWEDMRQARYQDMLHHSSGNGDIQRLLQRKSVSSFLGSGLRDLIDQLIVSRMEQSQSQVAKKDDIVVREKGVSRKEKDGSMVDEDHEDCRSRTESDSSEESVTTCSKRSWRPNDVVNNSETTSPSLEHSVSSIPSHHNSSTPQSPFPMTTHQTIEMELIYDLRGHMEQLHQEIMELRKSIKSCVNMQVKMQNSFKQNVVTATEFRPAQNKERKHALGLVKHNCSICHVMQVDSLLYRCGHMCTCYKCALEMQHTSGECPVCEAPIVDVVKAFGHEN